MDKIVLWMAIQTTVLQAHANERIGFPDRPTAQQMMNDTGAHWKALSLRVVSLRARAEMQGGWLAEQTRVYADEVNKEAAKAFHCWTAWQWLHGLTDPSETWRAHSREKLRERIGDAAFYARRWPMPEVMSGKP
jgi:hypothetical protein